MAEGEQDLGPLSTHSFALNEYRAVSAKNTIGLLKAVLAFD